MQVLARKVWVHLFHQDRPFSFPLIVSLLVFGSLLMAMTFVGANLANADGTLDVEIVAGYNLVVDSNSTSPSTYAPDVATVIGRFCNNSTSTTLQNVQGFIGDYAAGTPGLYPARDSSTFAVGDLLRDSGSYSFVHVGGNIGLTDATRYVGDLAPGECKVQYWHFKYPQCRNEGTPPAWQDPPCVVPTWGNSVKPDDDLWLTFDVWTTADSGYSANASWKMTMRNEISAMANKIEPNPSGRWFNTDGDTVLPGDVITSNGILYELGNIRQGFDNNGNYVPDYNAWLQPVGDPSYDPSCFRLIHTSGILTVTRGAGQPILYIPFDDQDDPHPIYGGPLYFTNLPPDNTGVRGEVFYTFLALTGPCSTALTPYQEVASGFDNEKFNGDYGTGIPPVGSAEPEVTLDKTGPNRVAENTTFTYNMPFANNSTTAGAGLTLNSGGVNMPVVVNDTVPEGLQYVCGSAGASLNFTPNNGVTIRYSADGGQTWSSSEAALWPGCPGTNPTSGSSNSAIVIQWWLNDPIPKKTGDPAPGGTATFQARAVNYLSGGGSPAIENCAQASFGGGIPFAEACITTLIEGTGTIGDFVWRDENNDGLQTGETGNGIDGVTVSLYWDKNGDGSLDDGDVLLSTQDTTTYGGNPGYYQFTNLPPGDFLVVVDGSDVQVQYPGYRLTTPAFYAVTLAAGGSYQDADFGFGPSLAIEKRILGSATCGGYEGREVIYSISLTNERPGTGETVSGGCRYPIWSSTGSTANPPKNFTNDYYAYGEPDDNYAYGNFAIGANRWIQGTGFDAGSASGTISTVEAVFRLYLDGTFDNDYAVGTLYQGATVLGTVSFLHDELTPFVGQANVGYLVWDISAGSYAPGGSWGWDDFAALTLQLAPEKSGGADASVIYLDAIGFRVTSSGPCPAIDENDIMTMVPLTDTYDTTYLQFVSAEPPHSSVDTSAGLITWNNVGPIYPGQTKTVYVHFLALDLGTTSVSVDNEAGVTGARFADGGAVNDVDATATGTICPTGSINGTVYSDLGTLGWNYTPGTDLPIPGVRVTLYGCYDTTTGDLITTPGNNKTCALAGGEWRARFTQVTDANGYYAFKGLLNGFYYVQVTSGDLPGTVTQQAEANDNQGVTGTLPNTTASGHTCGQPGGTCNSTWGDPTANLVTNTPPFNPIDSPGETINGVNFGYSINAGAYGSVWEDNNGDGDKDSGEGPIGSVTVWLYPNNDCSGTPSQTTTTDVIGRYQFGNLTAGATYCVAVNTDTLPGGSAAWSQTGESDGSINNRITFTAVAGTLSGSHDFGFRNVGSYTIGDTVYYDWNGDGSQQPASEEGIPNVTVYLYKDSNGNGVVDAGVDALIETKTTDEDGFYQFINLPADSYVVIVDTNASGFPANVVETQDPDESGVCTTCDSRGAATLPDSTDLIDFGYRPRGSGAIGDTVWRDMNGDGVQGGPSETGIANITVWLEVDLNDDGDYVRVATTVTDADGQYLFSNLPDGTYRVVVDSSDNDLPKDAYGYPYTPSTATTTDPITISDGNTYLDADFGFAPRGAIGDTVWYDNNGNGLLDAGEKGVPNVLVELWLDSNNDGSGDSLVTTTSTDSNGNYYFAGLPAGDYVVKLADSNFGSGAVLDASMFTQTYDPDASTVPCAGGECDHYGEVYDTNPAVYGLPVGRIDYSLDFGFQPHIRIGDTLWIDTDGNGQRDGGETGIGYITVELWDCGAGTCDDGDESLLATTVTDEDGWYTFGGLDDDTTYEVRVDQGDPDWPSGLANTFDPDGTTDQKTIVVVSGGSVVSVGGTCDGDCSLDADFGYQFLGPNSLSGTVFYDTNNDAIQDTSETTTYAGVTLYLWYCGSDDDCSTGADNLLVGTTTSDGAGDYSFTDLPDGRYVVSVNPDAPDLTGLEPTVTGSPTTYRIVDLDPAKTNDEPVDAIDQDFGFLSQVDMGDLPDSYAITLLKDDGARHIVPSNGAIYLGSGLPDTEPNGQESVGATGDGADESDNGVIPSPGQDWTVATNGGHIDVTVGGCAGVCYLSAWIDWGNDNSLGQAGDRILVDYTVSNGVNSISFDIPAGTDLHQLLYARYRLYNTSTMGRALPTGLALNGEVEDYLMTPPIPTAVGLLSFTATVTGGNTVLLQWETANEINVFGFNLYRADSPEGPLSPLNSEPIASQTGGGSTGSTYQFMDPGLQPGATYYYWIEEMNVYGSAADHGPISVQIPAALTEERYRSFLPIINK